jgi:hypothetical protein
MNRIPGRAKAGPCCRCKRGKTFWQSGSQNDPAVVRAKAVIAGAVAVVAIAVAVIPAVTGNREAEKREVPAAEETADAPSAASEEEKEVGQISGQAGILTPDYYVPDISKTYVYETVNPCNNPLSYQWIELDTDWYGETQFIDSNPTSDTYGNEIKDGCVYWTHYSPGGAPIDLYEGECIELKPVGAGESWECSWKAHNRHGDESYGYMKKTFVGWESVEIMGETMLAERCYALEDVRSWEYEIPGAHITALYRGTGSQKLGAAVHNGLQVQQMIEGTGLHIAVRDIDNSDWFIKFESTRNVEAELRRWMEILEQYINDGFPTKTMYFCSKHYSTIPI